MLRIQSYFDSSITRKEQNYVPLKQVSVNATIHSFAADVTITQVFRNEEANSIEAVYCFPIEEQAAVYSFTARIDDREIHAELKEKEKAQREYNDALQQGHGAYLLEQNEKSQDNFIINVGALPSSKECTITISYVTELDFVQGSTVRFVVPTTIAPRYNPTQGGITSPAGTNSKYVQSSPYKIDFRCRVEKMNRSDDEYIARINSPSHPIEIDLAQQDAYIITFAQQNTHLDRDILINIELSAKRTNTIIAVEAGAAMAVFTPTKEDCRQGLNHDQINEFIFVVDCSGSMRDENKIGLARQAMILFLKSLPLNCHFNIIRFGSEYQSLFNDITVMYNEENARKAEQLIHGMNADLGGTELLKPLQWLKQHSPNEGRARQIFLLTDGEISNVTEVIDLCRSMALSTRIFSFGLGTSPSRSLVKGLARSTNGRFVFIPPKSNVDVYVGEQLQKALQPSITNVHVQWNLGVDVQCAPTQSPPVYLNDRLIVYALTNDKTIPFNHNSSVELQTESDHRLLGVAKIDSIPNVANNQTIARLAAKALILELQHAKSQKASTGSMQSRFKGLLASNEKSISSDEKTPKQQIIDLSLKYNILSPHTAFIGIEKRVNASNADMVLREVPIEISADDQQLQISHAPLLLCAAGAYRPMAFLKSANSALFQTKNKHSLDVDVVQSINSGVCDIMDDLAESCNLREEIANAVTSPCFDFDCYDDSELLQELEALGNANLPGSSLLPTLRNEYDALKELEAWANTTASESHLLPTRRDEREETNQSKHDKISRESNILPSNDQDIVRYLINKQKFDGLWDLDSDIIVKLTGKDLTEFRSRKTDIDTQILNSVIVILILETRFSTFSSLWYGVVQKGRDRIIDLLGKDSNKIDQLFNDVRNELEENI